MADRTTRAAAIAITRDFTAALRKMGHLDVADMLHHQAVKHGDVALAKALEHTEKIQGVDEVMAELDRIAQLLDDVLAMWELDREPDLDASDARGPDPMPEWLSSALMANTGRRAD